MVPTLVAFLIVFAGSLALVLVITGLRQRPGRPWAELGLGAVLLTNLGTTVPALRGETDGPSSAMVGAALAAWLVVLFTFPDGRPTPSIGRWILGVSLAVVLSSIAPAVPDTVAVVGFVPAFAFGLTTQIWRYRRRSTVSERQATKWLLAGLVPAAALFLGSGLIVSTTSLGPELFEEQWYTTASLVAIWLVPITGALGLSMGDRGRIDRWVHSILVLCGVGLIVVWGYFLTVPHVGTTLAAFLAAGLVLPVHRPVGWLATSVVYGADGSSTLSMLGRRLETSVTPDDVTAVVARTVADGLELPYVAVMLNGGLAAAVGTSPGGQEDLERFPVVYLSSTIGEIVVAPRAGDLALGRPDRVTISRLAATAGPALHGASALKELSIARERLVLAREEERRRLRRDLHDDLAPTLAGLGLRAAAAESLATSDDERATRVHADLQRGIEAAIAQVREIAYDLRPPVLDDHGLEAAIRARLATEADADLDVTIEVAGLPAQMPAAVELAALRIVQEAVTNVRRHAGATTCRISLIAREGVLEITVVDDGCGLGPGARHGVGLRSIGERAEELGGSWSVRSGQAVGTTVFVELPTSGAARW